MQVIARKASAGRLSAIALAVLYLSMSAAAQHAATSSTGNPEAGKNSGTINQGTAKEQITAAGEGQRTATDAKGGTLREATPEEVQVLIEGMKAQLNDSSEGLTPVRHDDGSVSLDLQGRFQNVMLAKIAPDGTVSTECVSSTDEARKFLTRAKLGDPKKGDPKKTETADPAHPVAPRPKLEEK